MTALINWYKQIKRVKLNNHEKPEIAAKLANHPQKHLLLAWLINFKAARRLANDKVLNLV